MYSPIDLNIGAVQGARVHHLLSVTKPVDAATAPLYQALCLSETKDEFVLHFFRADPSGVALEYWTIMMTGVKVAAIRPILPNVKDEELLPVPLMEEVQFLYQEITWTHSDGYEFLDVWVQPPGA